jgi:Activator of Hsp90 ATPase homolog 1-like protein
VEHLKQEKAMTKQNLTHAFTVANSPAEVFAAINDVRAWWSGDIDGVTDKLGAEWTYRYKDMHRSKQRIVELIPGRKVEWQVVDSYLSFVEDKTEWDGTKIVFDILGKSGKTEVTFTHVGLAPDVECYEACNDAWGSYIKGSLRDLIATGKGEPNPKEA